MASILESLTVRVYTRRATDWTSEGERFDLGFTEPVVRIEARDGRVWELILSGGEVTEVTVKGPALDQAAIVNGVPMDTLTRVARAHLAAVESHREVEGDITPLAVSLLAGSGPARTGTPTLEEFAEAWHDTPEFQEDPETGELLSKRQSLARRWSDEVSVYAIDKWTREARQRGLIPPVKGGKRGPKRTPESPGSDR